MPTLQTEDQPKLPWQHCLLPAQQHTASPLLSYSPLAPAFTPACLLPCLLESVCAASTTHNLTISLTSLITAAGLSASGFGAAFVAAGLRAAGVGGVILVGCSLSWVFDAAGLSRNYQ